MDNTFVMKVDAETYTLLKLLAFKADASKAAVVRGLIRQAATGVAAGTNQVSESERSMPSHAMR